MDARHWLRELRTELVARKLPPRYVERFVLELSDHLTDLTEDRMSTDAKDLHGVFDRLGAPGHVAHAAAKEYRQARFSRRHPVLMFVLLPILSLPVLWTAGVVALVVLVKLMGIESGKVVTSEPVWQWANAVVPYLVVGLMVIPLAIAAAFFCRLASRAAVSWKWSLAACLLLAAFGGMAVAQFMLPTDTSQGRLTFGFGISAHPSASQVLQFLIPLAIGGWAVWQQLKRRDAGQALRAS
jgi:hypothetical protein